MGLHLRSKVTYELTGAKINIKLVSNELKPMIVGKPQHKRWVKLLKTNAYDE